MEKIRIRWDNNDTLSFGPEDSGFKLDQPKFTDVSVAKDCLDLLRNTTYTPESQLSIISQALLRADQIDFIMFLRKSAMDKRLGIRVGEKWINGIEHYKASKKEYKYFSDPINGYSIPSKIKDTVRFLYELGYPQDIISAVMVQDKERFITYLKDEGIFQYIQNIYLKPPGFHNNPLFKYTFFRAEERFHYQKYGTHQQNSFLLDDHPITVATELRAGQIVGLVRPIKNSSDHPDYIANMLSSLGDYKPRGRMLYLPDFNGDHIKMVQEAEKLIKGREHIEIARLHPEAQLCGKGLD